MSLDGSDLVDGVEDVALEAIFEGSIRSTRLNSSIPLSYLVCDCNADAKCNAGEKGAKRGRGRWRVYLKP